MAVKIIFDYLKFKLEYSNGIESNEINKTNKTKRKVNQS